MRAYKFLGENGHSVYSGARWRLPTDSQPGPWVDAQAVRACRAGIHACRRAELAFWLNKTLWEIELEGDVVEARHKVIAPRGRIVRAIDEYPAAVLELDERSAWRARDRAVAVLRRAGHDATADAYANASTLPDLEDLAGTVGTTLDERSPAGIAALLASDAAHFAPARFPLVHSPFLAAWAAGHEAVTREDGGRDEFDAAFTRERESQSQWLAERLALV